MLRYKKKINRSTITAAVPPSSQFRHRLAMVLATMLLFLATLGLNMLLFTRLEFARGINWIFLPAGMRLLCTLLFAEEGAIGLLLVSWLVSFGIFFPDDPVRAFVGGIVATVAPYAVYRAARHVWGLQSSLANLTSARLLVLVVAYSVASPLLHHVWFAFQGQQDLVRSFLAMFIGDLNGTLIVVYTAKLVLVLLPHVARR
jgi:hypothetical protein